MYDSPLPIAYYEDIASLNEAHGVYIVRHIETGQIYVRKILHVYSLDVYAYLLDHPVRGIPHIYALYEHEGTLTVIEEYIPGNTLQTVLDRSGSYSEREVTSYARQICKTLSALHHCTPPIIHRDIKPSNIILTEDDRIVLIDLNAARLDNAESAHDTRLLGTSGYAAPEQYGFGKSSVTADIYALGIMIQVLLTGDERAPYSGNSRPGVRIVRHEELPCSARLARIIRKCTQIDPNKRYPSADALAKALKGQPVSKRLIAAVLITSSVLGIATSIRMGLQDGTSTVTRSVDGETVTESTNDSGSSDASATIDSALIGVYRGHIGDYLILREDGRADYYCGRDYTELSMKWRVDDGTLSIEFPRLHCTPTAEIATTDEFYMVSASNSWTNETFTRTDRTPESYGFPTVTPYDNNTTLQDDGYMRATIDGLSFLLPRQYIDSEDETDNNPGESVYRSNIFMTSYEANIILREDGDASSAPDQQTVTDMNLPALYVDDVTYGDGYATTVAGCEAYTCAFMGTRRTDATSSGSVAESVAESLLLGAMGIRETSSPDDMAVSGYVTTIYNKDSGHYVSAIYYGTAEAYEAERNNYLAMLDDAEM